MTKVLTIDLDFISNPYAKWIDHAFSLNTSKRWAEYMEDTPFDRSHFHIDVSNLMYCFNTFLKALKSNPKVSFGYDHDSILFAIDQQYDIELINIDQHDDVFHGLGNSPGYEYELVTKHNLVNEGNWGIWLHSQGKLKSFTWIKNDNSDRNGNRNARALDFLGDSYQDYLKEEYSFDNYDFDYLHVCLSPQYIYPDHWHYFSMFINTYEHFHDKDATIENKKFEHEFRYRKLGNEILH